MRTRWRARHSTLFLFLGLLSLLCLLGLTLASLLHFLLFSPTLGLLGRLLCPLTLLSFLLCLLLHGTLLRFGSPLLLGTALRFGSLLLLCAALCFGSDLFLTSLLSALLSGIPLSFLGLTLALLFLSTLLCGGFLPGLFGALPLDALRIFGRLLCLSSILRRIRRLRWRADRRRDRARGNDGL